MQRSGPARMEEPPHSEGTRNRLLIAVRSAAFRYEVREDEERWNVGSTLGRLGGWRFLAAQDNAHTRNEVTQFGQLIGSR